MIALALAFAIGVQPLPPPAADPPPATPAEAARAWLTALRDGSDDRLAALTAYAFGWSEVWRPRPVSRRRPRRGPLPFAGPPERCPPIVNRASLMAAWRTCMWKKDALFISMLRFDVHARTGGDGLSITLEPQNRRRLIWTVTSLRTANRTVAVRVGVRPDKAGPRVSQVQVIGDYTYVEPEKRTTPEVN